MRSAHEITGKIEDAAFKTNRGTPVFKCTCGVKLEAFDCVISRRYILEPYLTKRQHDKAWREMGKEEKKTGRLLDGVEHNEYPIISL